MERKTEKDNYESEKAEKGRNSKIPFLKNKNLKRTSLEINN